MRRIIYRHVTQALAGETEQFREILVDGTNLIEREKKVDPGKSTSDQIRYKTHERNVDPSFAGYDLVQLIASHGFESTVGAHSSELSINEHTGEKIVINLPEMRQVFADHPRHHWSPAMTSVIAGLAGRTNWQSTEAA